MQRAARHVQATVRSHLLTSKLPYLNVFYKRYRVQLVVRVAALAATAALGVWLAAETRLYEAVALLGALLVWQTVALVRYAERWVRDLTRFLEAIRYEDFSQRFAGGGRGLLLERLAAAFSEINDEFRRVRAAREEQFRYLQYVVRHVGVALVSFRASGEVEVMNAAAKRLLDVPRLRRVQDLGEESGPLVRALLEMKSGERRLVELRRAERTLHLSVYATRFRLSGEAYVLASVQDIGDELAEKEMEAWQRLTRVLTHEIMNSVAPISSLAATADRLLGEDGAGKGGAGTNGASVPALTEEALADTREALRTIRRRGDALVTFVDAYRTFTRVPAPAFELMPAQELFAHVARLLGAQVERQGARLDIHVEPPDLVLTADPDLIEQVLINLVLNALQATEAPDAEAPKAEAPDAGAPRIALRARLGRQGRAVLEVADNGPGIPPDVQEKIFVPFFTTKAEGSGIGLSLSRQIMRVHGGTLGVRSAPGEETVFTLRF